MTVRDPRASSSFSGFYRLTVAERLTALRDRGVTATSEPSLKPWGWRSFEVRDPNGVILDFFHVAEPPMPPQG